MGTGAYIIFKTIPFDGYKLGMREFRGKRVVAIPEKRMNDAMEKNKDLCVYNKSNSEEGYMIFEGDEIPTSVGEFKDKFNRNEAYRLFYYEWKPIRKLSLF